MVWLYKLPNSCIALPFGVIGAALFVGVLFLRVKLLRIQVQSDHAKAAHDLGARATYTCHLGKVLVIPTLMVAWEHEYLYTALPITANFLSIPGRSATVFGPSGGHDSAIINAGAAFQLTQRLSTYVGYQGQLGRDRYDANAVSGGLSFSF
jgi:outer membrane autotransporter protein